MRPRIELVNGIEIQNVQNIKKRFTTAWLRGLLREYSNKSEGWKSALAKILQVYSDRPDVSSLPDLSPNCVYFSPKKKTQHMYNLL